jgi:hypothetical protein
MGSRVCVEGHTSLSTMIKSSSYRLVRGLSTDGLDAAHISVRKTECVPVHLTYIHENIYHQDKD